ncbi:hypothetical protein D3C84_995520 [compost metagenome]
MPTLTDDPQLGMRQRLDGTIAARNRQNDVLAPPDQQGGRRDGGQIGNQQVRTEAGVLRGGDRLRILGSLEALLEQLRAQQARVVDDVLQEADDVLAARIAAQRLEHELERLARTFTRCSHATRRHQNQPVDQVGTQSGDPY